MTKEEILAMEAGEELSAVVAEGIVGECYHQHWKDNEDSVYCRKCGESRFYHQHSQAYSTDIAAAWQVVEKMEAEGYGHKHLKYSQNQHEGVTWVFMQPGRGIFEASGRDIKEAICKATLLAKLEGEGGV